MCPPLSSGQIRWAPWMWLLTTTWSRLTLSAQRGTFSFAVTGQLLLLAGKEPCNTYLQAALFLGTSRTRPGSGGGNEYITIICCYFQKQDPTGQLEHFLAGESEDHKAMVSMVEFEGDRARLIFFKHGLKEEVRDQTVCTSISLLKYRWAQKDSASYHQDVSSLTRRVKLCLNVPIRENFHQQKQNIKKGG